MDVYKDLDFFSFKLFPSETNPSYRELGCVFGVCVVNLCVCACL